MDQLLLRKCNTLLRKLKESLESIGIYWNLSESAGILKLWIRYKAQYVYYVYSVSWYLFWVNDNYLAWVSSLPSPSSAQAKCQAWLQGSLPWWPRWKIFCCVLENNQALCGQHLIHIISFRCQGKARNPKKKQKSKNQEIQKSRNSKI